MKLVTKTSDVMGYILEIPKKHYRRLNSTKKIAAVVVFVLFCGYTFLFHMSDELVGKLGTLASVTIAGLVSWMQYDASRKNVFREREKQATERCNFLVGNLKKYAKADELGNIHLNFFGNNRATKRLPDGDLYLVEWEFSYIKVAEVADFRIVISRLSKNKTPSIVGNPVSMQLRERRGIQQMGVYFYKAADKSISDQNRVSVKPDYFSDEDWETLMYSIGGIMMESRWKEDPDSLDLNM